MNKLKGIIPRILTLLLPVLVCISCDRTRNMRGYDFVPDMMYSQAYETYSTNPNFKDSMTNRIPPAGSVPKDFLPFRYSTDPESRKLAGNELQNPFLPTPEILNRGKFIFTTFCIGCHGSKGLGNGHLYLSGLYPMKPRNLTSDTVNNLKDGEIFHTITLGYNSMQAHGPQVRPDDRWKVVCYIRKLQELARVSRDSTVALTRKAVPHTKSK